MSELEGFTPITDWTLEGRRALVATSEPRMRLLLDDAFTRFDEEEPIPWSDFGFRSESPIPEAVEWCIQRFAASKELDPARIPPNARSFRLFTQTRWWLSQKVTARVFTIIMARRRHADASEDVEQLATPEADDESLGADAESFVESLGATLSKFCARSCAGLVAYWFDGTERLRRALGHTESAPLPDAPPKMQSFHRFDAMFRFWQLHEPVELGHPWGRVFEMTMLTACDNSAPYRVPDKAVSEALGNRDGPREIGRARKTACVRLVVGFVERARANGDSSSPERFAAKFRAAFLKPTLAHALEIHDDPASPAQLLKELSRGET